MLRVSYTVEHTLVPSTDDDSGSFVGIFCTDLPLSAASGKMRRPKIKNENSRNEEIRPTLP